MLAALRPAHQRRITASQSCAGLVKRWQPADGSAAAPMAPTHMWDSCRCMQPRWPHLAGHTSPTARLPWLTVAHYAWQPAACRNLLPSAAATMPRAAACARPTGPSCHPVVAPCVCVCLSPCVLLDVVQVVTTHNNGAGHLGGLDLACSQQQHACVTTMCSQYLHSLPCSRGDGCKWPKLRGVALSAAAAAAAAACAPAPLSAPSNACNCRGKVLLLCCCCPVNCCSHGLLSAAHQSRCVHGWTHCQ